MAALRRLSTGRRPVVAAIRDGRTGKQQATALRDRFGTWGADFLRVAVTEAHSATMAGRLLGYPEGTVVRVILAPGACPECRRLFEGRTFTVRHGVGNPQNDVWPGKSNVGLKREQWIPTIPLHPRCRCLFLPVAIPGLHT